LWPATDQKEDTWTNRAERWATCLVPFLLKLAAKDLDDGVVTGVKVLTSLLYQQLQLLSLCQDVVRHLNKTAQPNQ